MLIWAASMCYLVINTTYWPYDHMLEKGVIFGWFVQQFSDIYNNNKNP